MSKWGNNNNKNLIVICVLMRNFFEMANITLEVPYRLNQKNFV